MSRFPSLFVLSLAVSAMPAFAQTGSNTKDGAPSSDIDAKLEKRASGVTLEEDSRAGNDFDDGDFTVAPSVIGDLIHEDRTSEELKVQKRAQAAMLAAKNNALNAGNTADPGEKEFLRAKQEAMREKVAIMVENGDLAGAQALAASAVKENPGSEDMRELKAFVDSRRPGMDRKDVAARVRELSDGMRSADGAENGAILATPMAGFVGGAAGGARSGVAAFTGPAGAGMEGMRPGPVREAAGKIALRDYAGAEKLLTRRLEAEPRDGGALRLRALARRFLKRPSDSADDARRVLEQYPGDSRSRGLLALSLVDLGRGEEAYAEASRAVTDGPNDASAWAARARVLQFLGRDAERLEDLRRAAALDPQFDALYRDALTASGASVPGSSRGKAVWTGAIGIALLFFAAVLLRRRGDSSVRLAMRREDHDGLARVAAPAPVAPRGFQILHTLGQGGMGVVYEAVDLALQRTVALKKLREEVAGNPRELARFLKEARTVAALKHPNIVEIHSIHENAGGLFLVFEKVPGQSLHEALGKGAMSPADTAGVLRQVAAALDYAHARGVVHQDLKPANIMVYGGAAKVMDFGIARRVQETLSTMSRVEIAGTPAYMAPEQERGVVTPAADLYALGVCAYETLTGSLPFPSGGVMLKAQKLYRPASEVKPGITAATDTVLGRALEPDPSVRWPSASSFVEALARSLA